MNAHSNIETPQAKGTNLEEFCRVRGRLVSLYAKLEQAIVGAIQRLDPNGEIPPTLNTRVKRTLSLLSDRADEAAVKKIETCLNDLAEHLGRRNALVHADGNIVPTSDEGWKWIWHCVSGNEGNQDRGWWTAQEMRGFSTDLHSNVDRLCAHLRKLPAEKS